VYTIRYWQNGALSQPTSRRSQSVIPVLLTKIHLLIYNVLSQDPTILPTAHE